MSGTINARWDGLLITRGDAWRYSLFAYHGDFELLHDGISIVATPMYKSGRGTFHRLFVQGGILQKIEFYNKTGSVMRTTAITANQEHSFASGSVVLPKGFTIEDHDSGEKNIVRVESSINVELPDNIFKKPETRRR